MLSLHICHLYPDLLNLYGDIGNIITLAKRSEWRGIDVKITNVTIGDTFNAENYDIIFLGGGQDFEQELLQADLLHQKGNEIRNAINGNKVFLCVCGGFQLMGKCFRTHNGKEIEFLGALDLWTIAGKKRMVGNLIFECQLGSMPQDTVKIVGFENHSGRTYLGPGVRPLGKVIYGYGNNGQDGYEGAVYKNVYCTYSHGSLLPKNPQFADHLIQLALKEKYGSSVTLDKLDDSLENAAHDTVITRILSHRK